MSVRTGWLRIAAVTLATALGAVARAEEPTGPLTLEQAMALALEKSPELAVSTFDLRAGEARTLQAGKPPNPELEVRVDHFDLEEGQPDEDRSRVILRQDFELGGKRGRRVDLAQTERELLERDLEQKRSDLKATVTGRFAELLGAQRRVAALGQFVTFFEELQDKVARLVATGAMRSLETHQIARQLGLARVELARAEAARTTARFNLAASWGGARSPSFGEALGALEPLPLTPDLDRVLSLAGTSPAVARWDAELAHGEAALDLAKAGRIPDVRLGAGTRWDDQTDDRGYLVELELALPIFDRKQGEIREASHEMDRARAGRSAAQATQAAAVAEVFASLDESRVTSQTLGQQVLPAARATFEALRIGFEETARNLSDLIDARRDRARAEVDYTDALVAHHVAHATLESLVGRCLTSGE